MTTRLMQTLGILGALALLAIAAPAEARNRCVDGARLDHAECKGECREHFQATKDGCLNRDHDCVEVCRAKREDCHEATGRDAALAACDATLRAARQACRADHPSGSAERDQCIDQAQVVAFQCRDAAREATRDDVRRCRRGFRRCARGCAEGDVVDRTAARQCRVDAKATFRVCRRDCREDLQVAKDACRNRDHECTEACRETRETCREPLVAQRDADVAACNATRDAAIDNCRSIFGPDTPERDTCIDNAQVDAFRCRDTARERARPGLIVCRDQFRDCVRACPPAP